MYNGEAETMALAAEELEELEKEMKILKKKIECIREFLGMEI